MTKHKTLSDYRKKKNDKLTKSIIKCIREESKWLELDFDKIPKEPEKRKDCFYYWEEQDMGAMIPCCTLRSALGDCPCSPTCKDYISGNDAHKIVRMYQG